ncbi:MarR family winged helix-turn-helix transcriptional regulator, partial [Streptomyces sp. SR27]|uniref:MarR family winged helix-turn-helix transcriptional regulator n=1 Tax=Streptomyces sp. SR27 TaxID=3076630 RepID=UPI00295B19AE
MPIRLTTSDVTAFARRARAAAARVHPELPLVSYTLLAHIEAQRGCRATDLAAHYLLDKSTVSRQVAGLEKLGLVERRPAPDDHRVHVLHPTEAGTAGTAGTQRNPPGAGDV